LSLLAGVRVGVKALQQVLVVVVVRVEFCKPQILLLYQELL
jgi:hypothetical protein